MTVRVYRSTDASAPVLDGINGSLIAVLDACLVNGYGAMASSGWAKSFTATNLAVYRPPAGRRHYLRVEDSTTQLGRLRAFGAMSDINTGTDPYPTVAQMTAPGLYSLKSITASSISRAWTLVATDTTMYYMPHAGTPAADLGSETSGLNSGGAIVFGDFIPYESDSWNSILIASNSASLSGVPTLGNQGSAALVGHFIPRDHTGGGTSVAAWKTMAVNAGFGATIGGTGSPNFPDGYSSNLRVTPIVVGHGSMARGVLPGILGPLHNQPANPGDTINGTGALAGKQYLIQLTGGISTTGRVLIEISDTW